MRNLKKILALVLALVMSLSLMATAGASSFSDVDDSNPYSTAIDVLDALKVFIGYEDGSFQPTGELTRAEAAVLVYRIATGDVEGKYVENYTYMANSKFNDLDNGYGWAKGYINYCQNAEIIKGTSATTFSPGLKVTGYQLMVMVLRTLGYDKAGEFSDPITWELESARKCEQLGMLKNIPNTGDFGNPAPRAMTAEILFRGLLQNTVKYSVMTPGGYTMDATTLGYQKFTLEEVTGVVMANEYADIHRNFDTNSDGHNQTAPAGVTVLDLGDGEEFNINVTTKLEDLGETRTTYTIENGKANGHELTGIALENPGTDDITYDNGEALTADQFRSYIHGNENQRYLNFGETSGNDTTSIKVTYEAARIIRNYSALTAAAAVTAFMNDFHLDPASAPAVVAAPVTRLGSGSYDVTYTPAATDLILLNGTSAASVSDRAGHVYSIVNHNGTVFYRVEIEPNTTYTELDEAMVRAIFSRASTTNGNNGLVVTGEVYRGTQFVTDYSDANSYETFVDNCINVADDHINANIDRNMRGWWLKIIDNDNDGITDWVFQTRYTVAKVSGVNADTGALTLDTADWRSTTGTTFGAANEAATWEGHNDAVNYNGNNITAVNYDGDTIEVGDVVYYARIDGKNYAWKCDVVTGRVESINRQALTVTLDNDETYTESEVHEHSIATDIASRVANMSGTVTMDLYMDKYGYMAAFSQNINGNFALLTNGWAQSLKNGVEYAVTAWDSTDQVLKQYDVNEGGGLFVDTTANNIYDGGSVNSWNRIRRFVPLNCDNLVIAAHTDDIHTIVAYKEDDGETARLIPVDTVYDVERQNGREIRMIDMNTTIPGSAIANGTIYSTGALSVVPYGVAGTPNATRVRTLSNTLYYYVYQSYQNNGSNANGLMVKQFTGYAAGANWLTAAERAAYVEDVYVVGTRAEDVVGAYYTANVVVVELGNGFRPETHKDNEQVFIYNTPTTIGWNTVEEVDAIRGNGANEKLKIDLGASRTYTEAEPNSGLEPGLYWLHRTSRTDSEGIWAVEHMHHDDIRLAGIYDVGTVFSSDFNLPNDYVQVTDWICAGGATHHVEDANPANLHNVAVTPAGAPVNPVPSAVTNPTRRAADTSKFYNLTYSNGFGTATEGTASGVLNQWATQWGDNTAGRVNQVLVRYDTAGNIVYAVSFDHGTLNGNQAQRVWRSILLDNVKGFKADGVVEFFGVTDRIGTVGDANDESAVERTIKVDYTDAKKAVAPFLTIEGVDHWTLTNTADNTAVADGQPTRNPAGNTWVLSYSETSAGVTTNRSYILILDPADNDAEIDVKAGVTPATNYLYDGNDLTPGAGTQLRFNTSVLTIPAYIGQYIAKAGSEDASFAWRFRVTASQEWFTVKATWNNDTNSWDLDANDVAKILTGADTQTIDRAECVVTAEDGATKTTYTSTGAYTPVTGLAAARTAAKAALLTKANAAKAAVNADAALGAAQKAARCAAIDAAKAAADTAIDAAADTTAVAAAQAAGEAAITSAQNTALPVAETIAPTPDVTTEADGSKTATTAPSHAQITEAVEAVEDATGANKKISIEVNPAASVVDDVKKAEVTLPKATAQTVADAEVATEIKTPVGDVTVPAEALTKVLEGNTTATEVKVVVEESTTDVATDTEGNPVDTESAVVADVDIVVKTGDTETKVPVTGLTNPITITLPVPGKTVGDSVDVYYVNNANKLEHVGTVVVTAGPVVTFQVNHLTKFVLVDAEPVANDDATLSALTYSVGGAAAVAVPSFAANTLTYNVELPAETAANAVITLTATKSDENAAITTNEGVTLTAGAGTATIVVTAEDGTTTKTYTVNFTTASATESDDATLSALSYSVAGGTAVAVPSFAADTLTYNVELPAETAANAAITLTATKSDENATITTNEGVTLTAGAGTATIVVTAEDGTTTKTYTVNFTTAPEPGKVIALTTEKVAAYTAMGVTNLVVNPNEHKISYTISAEMLNEVKDSNPNLALEESAYIHAGTGSDEGKYWLCVPVTVTLPDGADHAAWVSNGADTATTENLFDDLSADGKTATGWVMIAVNESGTWSAMDKSGWANTLVFVTVSGETVTIMDSIEGQNWTLEYTNANNTAAN